MQTLLNLLAGVALLVWGTHIVRTGILRVFGGEPAARPAPQRRQPLLARSSPASASRGSSSAAPPPR